MKTQKLILTIGVILVVIVVTGFITKEVIRSVTEKITRDITEREIARITQGEVEKITQSEIDRMVEEKTNEITRGILGQSGEAQSLQDIECDKTPLPRQFSSTPYYTGPLIDAHLHMPLTFDVPKALYAQADYNGAVLEKDVAAGSIICVFDKTRVQSAIGFYVIPSLLKGQAVVQIKQIEGKFPGRITPFIMPAHVSALNLQPADVEALLRANPGLFKGFGEIGLYKDAYKGTSPDDTSLLPFYEIADKYRLVVMIHPDEGQEKSIENILKDYPHVKFLFHGYQLHPLVLKTDFLGKYPNAYYSVDEAFSDIQNEGQSSSLYGDKSKEEFISKFKRDYSKIFDQLMKDWKGQIEKYPDQFLWSTDRSTSWHFDAEVGGLIEESARSFIGELDPAVQEKFAYQNAESLVG